MIDATLTANRWSADQSVGGKQETPGERRMRKGGKAWRRGSRRRGKREQMLDSNLASQPALSDEFDRAFDDFELADEARLSPEDRAYRAAQQLADKKVELSRRIVRSALITIPLLVFIPFVGVILLVVFGVDIGRRAFRLVYEPRLREKFLQDEVQRRVHTRVSHERQHLEGEHHRSLEHLSASIAHEIRNPITAAKSLVQQMGEEPNSEEQVEYARVAVAELERVEKSISHLLRFAREEEIHIEAVVMEDILESALETFRDRASRGEIAIRRTYDAEGRMHGDAEQLRRVIINLVGNAIDALEEGQEADREIRISMGENLAGSEIWVRISDNGPGIEQAQLSRIFDPFYTSRKEGTGLGLAMCRKIVGNHDGSIEVESMRGEGTEFVLVFPKRLEPPSTRRDGGRTR
jgi:signal transduction histidine kinase